MVGRDGQVKVLDVGIARSLGGRDRGRDGVGRTRRRDDLPRTGAARGAFGGPGDGPVRDRCRAVRDARRHRTVRRRNGPGHRLRPQEGADAGPAGWPQRCESVATAVRRAMATDPARRFRRAAMQAAVTGAPSIPRLSPISVSEPEPTLVLPSGGFRRRRPTAWQLAAVAAVGLSGRFAWNVGKDLVWFVTGSDLDEPPRHRPRQGPQLRSAPPPPPRRRLPPHPRPRHRQQLQV